MSLALFLSLLVKSSLVAAAGLIVARLAARRAADRVDILRATVCLLLALPVLAAVLPAVELALLPAASVEAVSAPMTPLWSGEVGPVAGVAVSASLPWPSLATMAVGLWLLGAALVVGRLLLGLNTLSRWTEQGRAVKCPAWRSPLEPLAPAARPRLVSSERVSSPLSWGLAPGVIVLDPSSLAEPKAASAVLAHELAHLRRKDWVFLILSRLALALFWFNPLVWRLSVVLAEASEEAADAEAVRTVDRRDYARVLVRLAVHSSSFPATAMAADPHTLEKRIACIMTNTSARRRPLAVALTVAALAVVATPLAALELREQASAYAPPPPPAPPAPPAPLSV
ncbi:M56 family metallopeptidase, partial [Brevundimonas sp.]|uniref:M56 family metallopeptidase n=1 Tax=Brevundimonas sp. TaxID=1871086 RepID=UPI002EDADE7D